MVTEEFALGRDNLQESGGLYSVLFDDILEAEFQKIPSRLEFKIGEVAEILGIKPYVLRYWETEFEILKPKKSKHNQRVYKQKDIEKLLIIKKLLYRDRYSIEGARSALKKTRKDGFDKEFLSQKDLISTSLKETDSSSIGRGSLKAQFHAKDLLESIQNMKLFLEKDLL